MDATAISLCMDNKLPIVVFNLRTPGNIRRAIIGRAGRHDRHGLTSRGALGHMDVSDLKGLFGEVKSG